MRTENTIKGEGGKRRQGVVKGKAGNKPLVSIITAVYNGNATIEETIKSVVNQNYPDFEYLVIDGGSTDGTVETLKKYNDVIDYWVSEPDKGVYDALNKGIELARGDWLYFIGSDDRLASEDVLSFMFSKPPQSKMLYGNVVWGNTGRIYDGKFSKIKLYYKNICHQAIFYHRDLFRKLGKFELKYPLLADWIFNMRAFAAKEVKPVFVNKVVAVYSTEGMSLSIVDHAFARDRALLIKRIFGIWHFINFKWLYKKIPRIDLLIKVLIQKYILFLKLPIFILSGKANLGTCPVCEHRTLFIKQSDWLRDNYLCLCCKSIPRQRALIKVLENEFPDWRRLRIHESSPSGAASGKIKRACRNYEPTQYWPDLTPGSYRNGQRCENLERMTFDDARFDLVITQDVFEHVMDPAKAFAEIARILKPGGAHIFTVPLYRGQKTVVRATATPKGTEYLREPVYHANPVDEKGSLVVTDWGDDLLSFIEANSGMKTEIHDPRGPRLGLEAEFLEVFVSRKMK